MDVRVSPSYTITKLTAAHAREICEWKYPPPYDIYSWQPWEQLLSQQEEFGDPDIREAQYRAVLDQHGKLCGYAQLFPIVGVTRLGLGMHPSLCGQGQGAAFVRAVTEAARQEAPGHEIDLEVLTWNHRAIRAYQQAGFAVTDTYVRGTPTGQGEFHCMVWEPSHRAEPLPSLPASLQPRVKDARWEQSTVGRSGSAVYRITDPCVFPEENGSYLKMAPAGALTREAEVMIWLQGRLPVPQVLHYESFEGRDYLLMSELPGSHAAEETWRDEPERMIRSLAEGLRLIHAIPLTDCSFDQRIAAKLTEAEERIRLGLVEEEDFEEEHLGNSAIQLLERVKLLSQQFTEELVFTHGDYCLPNIVLQEQGLAGFLDWGRAGVSDRYQDLALVLRSLRHNGYGAWTETFLTSYGLEQADPVKLECYLLLDELY